MSDKSILRKLLLAGIGAVATGSERAEEIVRGLIERGEITIEQGKVINEELKQRVKETRAASPASDLPDVASLTPQQRAELRRRLDALDASDAEACD